MSFITDAQELEAELRERIKGRRVLLEIGLDADLHERVTSIFEPMVRWRDQTKLVREFPATLATYLVGHAVYHYAGGAMWGSVDIEGITQSWGELFEDAIKRLGLETFDDLVFQENAQRYVSRIVAQGGLPRYCVGDLFKLILQDLPHSHSAEEMLIRWRSRSSTFAGIDRPVRRFFLYGGPIATDFLERCIELVRHEAQTGELPTPEEIGLPPYVLTAYRDFDRDLGRVVRSTSDGAARLAKPMVTIDPWSAIGPVLTLPAIRSGEYGSWVVRGDLVQRFNTSAYDERAVPLAPTATQWSVELDLGTRRQEWVFEASSYGPLLCFDPSNGTLVDASAGLRLDDVWVLTSRDSTLDGLDRSGTSLELPDVEELPLPLGEWSPWRMRHLDLTGLATLRLTRAGSEHRITLRPSSARPHLANEPVERVATRDGRPVYSDLPTVVLPSDPSLWSIRLIADGNTPVTCNAAEVAQEDRSVSLAAVAPRNSCNVQLNVRGPLGDSLRVDFVVVPGLSVSLPRQIVWPGAEASVLWSAASGSFDGERGVTRVETPLKDDESSAVTDWYGPSGLAVQLRASVPRLLWGPVTREGTVYSSSVSVLVADEVGSDVGGLAVSTGTELSGLSLQLLAGAEVLHSTAELSIGPKGRWVFSLAEFSDTFRTSRQSSFSLRLRVGIRTVEVARIRATLDIRDLVVHSRVVGEFTSLDLEFEEGRPLAHRVVRLWSLDRPWVAAVVEPIPDEESGHASINRYDVLPPGRYLVELGIDDGWSVAPKRPAIGPTVAPVQIGSAEDRELYLEKLSLADPLDVLEIAAATGVVPRAVDESEFARLAPAALLALRVLYQDRRSQPRQFMAVEGLLLASTPALVGALIDAAVSLTWTSEELLRLQIGLVHRLRAYDEMQIEDQDWRSLWISAPIVAAALEFRPGSSEQVCDRVINESGWDPRTALDIDMGQPIDQHFVNVPAEQLEQIVVAIGLPVDVPTPWLHDDAWVRSNFQWLRAHKGGVFDAEQFWQEAKPLLRAPLPDIAGAAAFVDSRLCRLKVFEWAGLTAASLAAACHLVADSKWQPDAQRLLMSLAGAAPLLVTRDLIIALALSRLSPDPEGSSE